MAETARSLYDDENDEVTGVRKKPSLNIMDILSRMDDEEIEQGLAGLRGQAEQNGQLKLFDAFDEDDLLKMVALNSLTEGQLRELAQAKHNIGFHGGVPKILDYLFRLTGDPKFQNCLG